MTRREYVISRIEGLTGMNTSWESLNEDDLVDLLLVLLKYEYNNHIPSRELRLIG
jgi:hypothetical protein